MLSLTEADPVGLLKHLPKEMDQVAHRQRAIQWECPIQMDVSTSSYVDAKKRQVTHTPTPYPDPRALSQPYPNPRITIGRTATPSLSCNGGTCSPSCATTTTDGSILMSTQPRCAPLCCAPLCCAPLCCAPLCCAPLCCAPLCCAPPVLCPPVLCPPAHNYYYIPMTTQPR
jgi:hypothetical protein